jgi:hypothetical protein
MERGVEVLAIVHFVIVGSRITSGPVRLRVRAG